MKRYFILLLSVIAVHSVCICSVLYPIEKIAMDTVIIENNLEWNFDRISDLDEKCKVSAQDLGKVLYENYDRYCRAYQHRNDSILYCGYNVGRNECILLDEYILVYNAKKISDIPLKSFTGHGSRNNTELRTEGNITTRLIGSGKFIYGGDTISNVTLLKEILNETCYQRADSADISLVDNQTIIYRWLGENDVLPLAVQIETSGSINEKHLFLRDASDLEIYRTDIDTPTAEDIIKFLESANATVTNGSVIVNFDGQTLIDTIELALVDINGFVAHRQRFEKLSDHPLEFLTSDIKHGRYILQISVVNNSNLTHRIILNL